MGRLQDQGNRLGLLQNTMITITLIINVIDYDCDYILSNHDYIQEYECISHKRDTSSYIACLYFGEYPQAVACLAQPGYIYNIDITT